MAVLVIGGTGIDTLVPVSSLSAPTGDTVMSGPIRDLVAHTGTGVALGLRALGVPVTMIDAIGDDAEGSRIRAAFADWAVPLLTGRAPAGTRRAVNLMAPDGRRRSFYDGRDTPGYRLPPEAYQPALATATHAHVSIIDWTRHLLPDLRRAGLSISTDLHDWDFENPYHRDFAYGADVVFLNAVALRASVGEVARDIFAAGVASLVLVTAGAAGATMALRGATEPVVEPAADPGGPVTNTNGAGDAFAAAFLAGWTAGRDPADCLRDAAIAGAFACTRDVGADGFIDAATLASRRGPTA